MVSYASIDYKQAGIPGTQTTEISEHASMTIQKNVNSATFHVKDIPYDYHPPGQNMTIISNMHSFLYKNSVRFDRVTYMKSFTIRVQDVKAYVDFDYGDVDIGHFAVRGIVRFWDNFPKNAKNVCVANTGRIGISYIDNFPKSVKKITVDNSALATRFGELPDGLEELHIRNSALDELPLLPKSLKKLIIENTRLRKMESLAQHGNLKYLDITNNMLECQPVIPPLLKELRDWGNLYRPIEISELLKMSAPKVKDDEPCHKTTTQLEYENMVLRHMVLILLLLLAISWFSFTLF